MKRIQKMLMGIAISVFGCAVASHPGTGPSLITLYEIGCIISLIGLLYAWYGFYWSNDDE